MLGQRVPRPQSPLMPGRMIGQPTRRLLGGQVSSVGPSWIAVRRSPIKSSFCFPPWFLCRAVLPTRTVPVLAPYQYCRISSAQRSRVAPSSGQHPAWSGRTLERRTCRWCYSTRTVYCTSIRGWLFWQPVSPRPNTRQVEGCWRCWASRAGYSYR